MNDPARPGLAASRGRTSGRLDTRSIRGLPARLQIFQRDRFNRLLGFFVRRRPGSGAVLLRIVFLIIVTWVPLVVGTWFTGNLANGRWRESLLLDFACWAQFWGFIPLSLIAESYIEGKMRESIPHAAQLLRERNLAGLADKATRNARWWLADGVCILLAFTFTLAWAVDEVSNDVPSWHTSVAGGEHFTFAGWWVAFVGLPIFTCLCWAPLGMEDLGLDPVSAWSLEAPPQVDGGASGSHRRPGALSDVQKRLTATVAAHSRRLEEDLKGATQENRLRKAELASYEELAIVYQAVRQMRVVPFDARSIAELVTSSAAPFAPLLLAVELPEKLKALVELRPRSLRGRSF